MVLIICIRYIKYLLTYIFYIGREEDFIWPEDLDPVQNMIMEIEERRLADERQNIPYAPVPDVLPQADNMCVVCLVCERQYALIPCGHQVLCLLCSVTINPKKCPMCNSYFTATLRVYSN